MPATPAQNSESTPSRPRSTLLWRIVAFATVLSAAIALLLTWTFSRSYDAMLQRELDQRLIGEASLVAEVVADNWPDQPTAGLQNRIRGLGERAGVRCTLIDLKGRVLADSFQPDLAAVMQLEHHRDRPEIIAAIRSGRGAARRLSPTLAEPLRYQAVRVDGPHGPLGVIRIAARTAAVTDEVHALQRRLASIGLAAVLATAGVTYLAARRILQPMYLAIGHASSLAAGEYQNRLVVPTNRRDDLASLATALNDLGARLAHRERQLASASETHATVLEAMTESVIAVDNSERILFANASAARVFGLNAKQLVNCKLLRTIRSHELRAVMQKARRSLQLCSAEISWRGKPGCMFDALATPLPGSPSPGVVIVLRDISELKRLEQMRQQFVANVSHELKTPLSSIKAYTETLLDGARHDPVHCERFLHRIDEQATQLQQLILDMLSLARIESVQGLLKVTEVSAQEAIHACLRNYEPQAGARGVQLESANLDSRVTVRADEEALRQILGNLVDNAIKYTPAGGCVTVALATDPAAAIITVTDTGVGIAAEHLARLFERFYRVDVSRSRELGGTGLGLSIVKHLTQAMGGTVTVASEVGVGSTFTVRLPLANKAI